MVSEWQPANEAEHEIAAALADGDSARFAKALASAALHVPDLPAQDSDAWHRLVELLPFERPHVVVFTSKETMAWVLGDLLVGHQELAFPAIRDVWPDLSHQLAVNPKTPIGVYMPIDSVEAMARGHAPLVRAEDIREVSRVVNDQLVATVRDICMAELAGRPWHPTTQITESIRDDEPVNALETELRHALEQHDADGFLLTLVGADVTLPTASPVENSAAIADDQFPWRTVGKDSLQVIPMFSSAAALERIAGPESCRLEVSFLEVMAHWPGTDYVLCFNPGLSTELVLPGELLPEIGAAVLAALDDEQTADGAHDS